MIEEMNRRFAQQMGWRLKSGAVYNEHKTFLPYFLMDASYQEWCKVKREHSFAHEDQQAATRITKAFHSFFLYWRSIFTPEQQDYLLEITDEFEAFIPHHVTIAQIAYTNAVDEYLDYAHQQEIAQMWTVNILAAIAQGWYGIVTPSLKGRPSEKRRNADISAVLVSSKRLASSYFGSQERLVYEKDLKSLELAINTLVNQIELWIRRKHKDYHDEIELEAQYENKIAELKQMYQEQA